MFPPSQVTDKEVSEFSVISKVSLPEQSAEKAGAIIAATVAAMILANGQMEFGLVNVLILDVLILDIC
jgi:hypothetical protein